MSKATAIAFLLLTVAGCGTQTSAAHSGASLPASSNTEPTMPQRAPDARYSHSCDLLLNSNFNGTPGWLVGDAGLKNTGNVGVVVKVTAVWDRAGSGPIHESKKLRLPYHKRRSAHFKVPVDENTISAVQAVTGYQNAGHWCGVKATLVSTFGQPH